MQQPWPVMVLAGLLLILLVLGTTAFHVPSSRSLANHLASENRMAINFGGGNKFTFSATGPLYFWGNKNKGKNEEAGASEKNTEDDGSNRGKLGGLPFFPGRREKSEKKDEEEKAQEKEQPIAVATVPEPSTKKIKQVEEQDPTAKAKALRAQAGRARLEAERLDAELTLTKIARLEKKMAAAVAKGETDNIEKIQHEIDALQARMRGEMPRTVLAPKKEETEPATLESSSETVKESSATQSASSTSMSKGQIGTFLDDVNTEDMEDTAKALANLPGFLKKLMAQTVELDFDTQDDINCTEVAIRMEKLKQIDFSFSKRPKPEFTQAQIEHAKKELLDDPMFFGAIDKELLDDAKGNDTKLALMGLEYNYYVDQSGEAQFEKLAESEDWLKGVIEAVNKTAVDSAIETIYPKCIRKEDAPVPTLAQVQMLMSDVLPKASFTPRGKPEEVPGGYIVRGSSRYEKGDEILDAIEGQLAKSDLRDKMTVLVSKDFTLLASLDGISDDVLVQDINPDNEPPILYIMGPDIAPERRRIALSLTSALGIASCWYLSIYPFLLNPAIMKRTEEQLTLADASMAYDLSWLTELSLPLFFTFIGIQVAHEVGHRIAASLNEVETTLPTFVPSLITGITSSVTQFKTPPKNKEALFDISFAGPIVGIATSIAALVIGSQLTATSDPGLLPALPIEILRQSTLGGGIIDSILGEGALSIPQGAEGTQAVAGMTVSLHPVAVAGYISLIVNALALLPIGTTDGGRIALAVYGRGTKLLVGNIMLFTVFLVGLLGSDLFLFYFAFLVAFQTGNEMPARNEYDNISFPRVCLAIGSTVVALLTLIPFQ